MFVFWNGGGGAAGLGETHPLPVQQQVDLEGHAVVDGHLLVAVEDLDDAAEHGSVVDPRRAEGAVPCRDRRTTTTEVGHGLRRTAPQ